MKVLVCGDSWSAAWGVEDKESWHNYLGYEIVNVAQSGASNSQIYEQFLDHYNENYDLIIVGWSGSTRIVDNKGSLHQFSCSDKKTIMFFKDISLQDILSVWQEKIDLIEKNSVVPVIHFSVFGDIPLKKPKHFIEISYLEFLANQQDVYFQHKIPIFEFGWLSGINYKLVSKFAKKNFARDWKKACVEREYIKPGKYFLPCGHPNPNGHILWGEFIKGKINDLFKK